MRCGGCGGGDADAIGVAPGRAQSCPTAPRGIERIGRLAQKASGRAGCTGKERAMTSGAKNEASSLASLRSHR